MSAKSTQPAAIPTRFSAATGSGPLVIIMLKIMKTNNSVNQFIIRVLFVYFSHYTLLTKKLNWGSLSLSTCWAHAKLLNSDQQLSYLNGLGKKSIKMDSQIF